ncbi:MAG: HEAT repeat domain-containing protein [Planctomycetota bacterium]
MNTLGRAEYEALLALIASGKEGANVVKAILDKASPVLPEKAFDEAELKKLIRTAVTAEDNTDRFEAQMTLSRVYGEFAVPGLVAYLSSSNTDYKVAAHIALSRRIGRDAVLPLIEALNAKDAGVRRMVATELGLIGDERALAALAEMAATEQDGAAKKEADTALGKLTQKYTYAAGMSAADLWARLAKRYYAGDYAVLSYADRPMVVWSWAAGDLKRQPTPRHLYVLKLAEQACYKAMAADSSNTTASALLCRVLASEKMAADVIEASGSGDDLSNEFGAGLRDANGTIAAMGWDVLAEAVGGAIDDGDLAAAAHLLGVMPWVYADSEFGADSPVVRALGATAANVRAAAAEAVLRFNGRRRITAFPDPAGFLGTLAQAGGKTVPRQILVVDANDARRNTVLTALNAAGYNAFDARSGSDGVVRALRFAGLDMVIMSTDLDDMEALAFISRLKDEDRTANVSVVVVGTSDQAADENWTNLYSGKAKATVGLPEGPGIATEEFNKVIAGSFGGDNPGATAAFRRSATVLDALAETDAQNPLFPWNTITPTLVQMLGQDLPDDPPVRNNLLRAIGNIGDASAVGPLAQFFGATDNDNLRAAAGMAIASVCNRGDVSLDDASFKALLKGTTSASAGVRKAAFAALGSAKLVPAQSMKVATTTRPGVGAPSGGDGCDSGDEGNEDG